METIKKKKLQSRHLGKPIDNKLTWSHQINNIQLKISKGIVILIKLRRFVCRETFRVLFQCHINYGHLINISYGEVQWLVI